MKILVIGATGTIGSAVVKKLSGRCEVIFASRTGADVHVDLSNPDSIISMFRSFTELQAVICAVGVAAYGRLFDLTDAEFRRGFENKLMRQVNLIRYGINSVIDNGSFTLTGGLASRYPFDSGGASISMCNAGLEGFVKAAAKELPRGIRLNLVAPGWISETLVALNQDPSLGVPADAVATKYIDCLDGGYTGNVIDAG